MAIEHFREELKLGIKCNFDRVKEFYSLEEKSFGKYSEQALESVHDNFKNM